METDPDFERKVGGSSLILDAKTRADGQGCQSSYQVQETCGDGAIDDSSLYSVQYVPLTLRNSKEIIWNNPQPNSPFSCRSLFIAFMKEDKQSIQDKFRELKSEIDSLEPATIQLKSGFTCELQGAESSSVCPSMFDGKSLTNITSYLEGKGMSYAKCHACKHVGKQFMLPEIWDTNQELSEDVLNLGISVLHCLLRVTDFIFKLAIKLTVPGVPESDPEFKNVKQLYIDEFEKQLKVKIFRVKVNFGTSNTGNCCRIIMNNAKTTAEILKLPIEMIQGFQDLLNMIADPQNIPDIQNYEEIARKLFRMLTSEFYGQVNMTPTVHRLIVHGSTYIKHYKDLFSKPIGAFSESSIESRNKDNKIYRSQHAFQGSLSKNIRDIGTRLLATSDPYLFLKEDLS